MQKKKRDKMVDRHLFPQNNFEKKMSLIIEAPYIAALKECSLSSRCSSCFQSASVKCPECQVMVYCNEECRMKDKIFHQFECQTYRNHLDRDRFDEMVLVRMIARVIIRLGIDDGEPEVDLCSNVPDSIRPRTWWDLLGHRDEILRSERHKNMWLTTINQLKFFAVDCFRDFDLLDIFGKLLINRFRVGIHENLSDGRIAVGWAIYLTTSRFNHSCQPDLLQCSYDINMRLKFANANQTIPRTSVEFDRLTVSYRHQNDFRLSNDLTYVPTRRQRRQFVSFFFFNCHCQFCADDLRNRYSESATNRLCEQCGDALILQENSHQSNTAILTCLGRRKKCSNIGRVVDRVTIPIIDPGEQSMEEKLVAIEEILHPQSVLLLQEREKIFFAYQKLLNQCDLNENQRMIFLNRAIQLGEILLETYHIHLKHSSIYPKIIVTDLANLCQASGRTDKAKELYQKAIDLWQTDYADHLDYQHFNVHSEI